MRLIIWRCTHRCEREIQPSREDPGQPNTPWMRQSSTADSRGFPHSTADMQRATQKISVANLVREDEKENLREKHRDLVVIVLTKYRNLHSSTSLPTPRSTS